MARMMCGLTLLDRIPSDSILSRLGIQKTVIDYVEKSKLRWFGYVVRREDSSPIQEAYFHEVPGKRPKGRPRKTWIEDVKEEMRRRGLTEADAHDRKLWRSKIQECPADPVRAG